MKLLITGALATIAVVAISTTAQAQPITGWGMHNQGSYNTVMTVVDANNGNFQVFGAANSGPGNDGYFAVLPSKFTLQNIGDRVQIDGMVSWTNGGMGSGLWRLYFGTTNAGVGSPGVLSGGIWSNTNNDTIVAGQCGNRGWLGYNINAGGGVAAAYTRPSFGTSRPYESTAFDVTALNLDPGYAAIPAVIPGTGMNASGAPYYFHLAAQLVAPQIVAVGWCITNAAYVTNGTGAFGDTFTWTNFGAVIDDSTLAGPITGARVEQADTKTFDVFGIFENSTDRGGCTEIDYNNVSVSFTANNPNPFTNIVIDAFDPTGYNGNSYTGGQLINVWTNWFGAAWVTNEWSSTNDASGNDGSIRVTATWPNTTPAAQFMEYNQKLITPFALPPSANGSLTLRLFGADVFYDSDSPVLTNGTTPIYGHLRFGQQDFAGNFQQFSNAVGTTGQGFEYPQASNGWRHLHFPMNGFAYPQETLISNIAFGIDGNWYPTTPLTNGTTKLFVDNVVFLEQTNLVGIPRTPPQPTMGIEQTTLGLRIFNTGNTRFTRNELGSGQTESWVSGGTGTYPVSYSFNVSNMPALSSTLQLQVWLIPTATMGTNNPYSENQIDVNATNAMAFIISSGNSIAGTNQVYGEDLLYKTNAAGASLNPGSPSPVVTLATNYQTAVTGPASANGTWTLTFLTTNTGSISGPGITPVNFTMPPGDVKYFDGNLVAYFGIQANGSLDVHADFTRVTIVDPTTAVSVDDDFAGGADLSHWTVVGDTTGMWFVRPGAPWWVNWTTPAIGYDVEENNNNNLQSTDPNWINPGFYTSYGPALDERLEAPTKMWTQILTSMIPPGQTNGYFRVAKPANF